MSNLKDLRDRIASVKATQKITQAMKMVAASKLRRAQSDLDVARSYAQRMDTVIKNISSFADDDRRFPELFVGTGRDQIHLLVIATSEKGLCGSFNSSIAKLARHRARELLDLGKEVKILCIGSKGVELLKSEFHLIMMPPINFSEVKGITYEKASDISNKVLSMFHASQFDVATLFYSKFHSVISQIPTARNIIPSRSIGQEDDSLVFSRNYDYEPDQLDVLNQLLPCYLVVQIFRVLLENAASEQGARMSAMDHAASNAGEMIDQLTLTFNRQRQAQITKELIEIISGAEAL
ncbi:F0F1 ATP synthase subunit gamma [Candidatus Endowatersipora endosymbiont of Watersipora subatra]|uniref:F0F1 ATP synthase subunit gamma n=1 Tax=Candidatus Endowatersipora endosymbiont of Watersipora subatra TaxID=3077946 RepID=UPI00312C8A0A